MRGDGSTAHEGIFDSNTGEFLRQSTHQGWRDDSSWARGLAWALYGFGTAYRFTRDARFLQTAEACADFYIEHTPLTACRPTTGMSRTRRCPTKARPRRSPPAGCSIWPADAYRVARACAIATTPCASWTRSPRPDFLASQTPGWEGILKHGMYHQRKGLGVDEERDVGRLLLPGSVKQGAGL